MTSGGALQTRVLADLAAAANYRRWMVDLTAPYLGRRPVEVGSGRGDCAADWAARGHQVTATEKDPARLAALRRRFADHPRVVVRPLALPADRDGDHTAAVAINVLEHIPDDVAALAAMGHLVRPGGRVVVIVPAFAVAMSRFDRAIGHQRRYRRDGLCERARAAGLVVGRCHYVNAVGLIGWLVVVRWLGGRPTDGLALRTFDRVVVPVLRRLEARRPPPFGQSVLLVARVPDDHS